MVRCKLVQDYEVERRPADSMNIWWEAKNVLGYDCDVGGEYPAEVRIDWNQYCYEGDSSPIEGDCRIHQVETEPAEYRSRGAGTIAMGMAIKHLHNLGCRTFTGLPISNFWGKFRGWGLKDGELKL